MRGQRMNGRGLGLGMGRGQRNGQGRMCGMGRRRAFGDGYGYGAGMNATDRPQTRQEQLKRHRDCLQQRLEEVDRLLAE